MNKKERRDEQIYQHGLSLAIIFLAPFLDMIDPVKLAKQVRRLEVKANKLATDYCNGENDVTTRNWGNKSNAILDKLDKIIGFRKLKIPVFLNGDARGYSLKIDSHYMEKCRHLDGWNKLATDWGGYGILAPDFDGK
ncbi:MAG: hypothetical protein WC417_06350 [Candidatus Omnitrophota bacterium]|jgi:hypothetical protein